MEAAALEIKMCNRQGFADAHIDMWSNHHIRSFQVRIPVSPEEKLNPQVGQHRKVGGLILQISFWKASRGGEARS